MRLCAGQIYIRRSGTVEATEVWDTARASGIWVDPLSSTLCTNCSGRRCAQGSARRCAQGQLYIGGQTRADFFKSLHESAKSASGELFADFLQTFFHEMHTFCRLFTNFFCGPTTFMHTFAHFLQQMIQVLQTSCTLILYLPTFCRTYAPILQIT